MTNGGWWKNRNYEEIDTSCLICAHETLLGIKATDQHGTFGDLNCILTILMFS